MSTTTADEHTQPYWFREFTQEERDKAEASGAAMPGGGYPIENEQDLRNAMRAIGRASDPAATKAHIRKRAAALGLTSLLSDAFKASEPGSPDWERQDAMQAQQAIGVIDQLIQRESQELAGDPGDADDVRDLLTIRDMLCAFAQGELAESYAEPQVRGMIRDLTSLTFDEPTGGDVSVPGFVAGKPPRGKRRPNYYAQRLKQMLAGRVGDLDLAAAHKGARAYAGAMGRHQPATVYAEPYQPQTFAEGIQFVRTFMEPPEWIPIMPVPHTSKHPEHGDVVLTPERNRRFMQNFKDGFYQKELPIDGEHDLIGGGAHGFITDIRMNDAGGLEGKTRWTDRGETGLKGGRWTGFSPSWFDEWTDKVTGETRKDVLIGGALVNRPFYKHGTLPQLDALMAASEQVHAIGIYLGNEQRRALMATKPHTFDDSEPDADDVGLTHGAMDTTHGHMHNNADGDGNHNHQHSHDGDGNHNHDHTEAQMNAAEPTTTAPEAPPAQSAPAPKSMSEELAALKAQNAALRQMSEAAAVTNKQMAEQVRTLVERDQTARYMAEIMGRSDENGTPWWLGAQTAFGEDATPAIEKQLKSLRTLAKTFGEDSEEFRDYVAEKRAVAAQVRASEVFSVKGLPGISTDSRRPEGQLEAAAKQFMDADPHLTHEKAIVMAMERNKDLYTEADRTRPGAQPR